MAALPKINLKAEVPAEIKAEVEQTKWGRVLMLTPVVLTVIATLLAGLASSEMTRAQYDRSLAAQRQSKAGDQWNFFQAKKLRALMLRTPLELARAAGEIRPLDAAALAALTLAPAPATPEGARALAGLREGKMPSAGPAPEASANVQATLAAAEKSRPDAEIAALLARVSEAELDAALQANQAQTLAFDAVQKPVSQAIEAWERALPAGAEHVGLRRDFVAARMEFTARRYDAEARLNQAVAGLFELQVRASNIAAERHHRRSGRFFFGMLAAQVGVIVATFALAVQRRNLLWGIAAAAGVIAIVLTIYVAVYV
ncbi:MAG: hypothetical protein RLZZ15_3090 [Verrucomicrobiota bacterium]|jgi:hypothetical protein